MRADAEFWHNHTVVGGSQNTKRKKNFKQTTEGPALESEYMRAEQGLQHENSLWEE